MTSNVTALLCNSKNSMLLRYAPVRDAVRNVTCRRCHRCLFCVLLCAVCTLVLCHTLSYALRSVSGIGGKMLHAEGFCHAVAESECRGLLNFLISRFAVCRSSNSPL